jgi:hypothetical protein
MPKPIAICIENLDPNAAARFVRCVAVPGRQPGLRLDAGGQILWKSDAAVACELWVSADDCLILYRPEGAAAVTLHRAGRSLDVPFGKPVVVIHEDEVAVAARRFRVHVHGEAPAVAAPSALTPQQGIFSRLKHAAAAAAILGAVAAVEVRCQPPVTVPPEGNTGVAAQGGQTGTGTGTGTEPIEIRDKPPMRTPEPPASPPPEDEQTGKTEPAKPPIDVRVTPPELAPEAKDPDNPGQ